MAVSGGNSPFFSQFAYDLDEAITAPAAAVEKLIARNPLLFQVTMFRAFLRLPEDKIDNMGYDDFIDYTIMLKEVLKVVHAPYIQKEDVNVTANA